MSSIPIVGTTGHCHESTAAIGEAAAWLATTPAEARPRPIIPGLQERFGLTAAEACAACREAALIKARAV
jgi:hypothetical protein